MKKGLIVVNAYCNLASMLNQANRLTEEFNKLGVEITVIKNGYSLYLNENGEIKGEDFNYDFCVYLDKDKYFATLLEKKGIRLFNKISSIINCDDKMLTNLALVGSGVEIPETFSSPLNYVNAEIQENELKQVASVLGFPLVVKLSFSSLGKGVYLVNNMKEFLKVVNDNKNQPKIYQKYISSSFGTDVRIICVGKIYLCAMQRKSETDFRSNAELGGKGYEYTPSDKFIKVAEKVAEILDLDYMGIDLLFGENNNPILCEVNSNAFFGVMEKTANVNVAKAYAEYVFKTIYNGDLL